MLLAALAVAGAQALYEPTGSDLRVSHMETDANRIGQDPEIVYNSVANEYLVVWEGDGLPMADGVDNEFEIFGQRLSATGAELGGDFRISNVDPEDDPAREARTPAVAYNPADNEYLVTWQADALATDNKFEIFGQLLNATGGPIGADFQISSTGLATDTTVSARDPDVAFNPIANQYLVVFGAGNYGGAAEIEIFGQDLDEDGGAVPSATDFQISDGGDMDMGMNNRQALHPSVASRSAFNEYLVTWDGDGLATNNEYEIFGQRVEASDGEQGVDFRISSVAVDGDTSRAPTDSSVVYGSGPNEYLVAWWADDEAVDSEHEVYVQRVSALGVELGADDAQISTTGPDGSANTGAIMPAAAYSPTSNEYLVTWIRDPDSPVDESEVFGQQLSSAGAEIGTQDMRISTVGPAGDLSRDAEDQAVAFGSAPNEYLSVWEADGLATLNDFEIFAHRLAVPVPVTPVTPATPATPTTKCKKKKKKRAVASKKKKKKGCKKKKKRK